MEQLDFSRWFEQGELVDCPHCRQATALPTPVGDFHLCSECGLVDPSGTPVRDLLAAPPA